MRNFLFIAIITVGAGSARADDVDVQVVNKVLKGQDKPAIILTVNRRAKSVSLELKANDGSVVKQHKKKVRQGKELRFILPSKVGITHYEGQLSVVFADGATGGMPLVFDVEVADALGIEVPYDRLDLAHSRVDVKLTRAADKCRYVVTFDGQGNQRGVTTFSGEPGGTWLPVEWDGYGTDDTVLKIRLVCYDTTGFSIGIEVFPWQLEIPHEDVTFASGSAEISADEAPKLVAALDEIQTAARRYGKVITIKLFVIGYTDTVGPATSNMALSKRRARSIAAFFRKKGVRVPIDYAGFGEENLAVATPDETDNINNRRARYILGVSAPEEANWNSL